MWECDRVSISYVSTAEAAEMLGVHRVQVGYHYRKGHLTDRQYRVGKDGTWSYHYRRWEVKALAKARRTSG